MEQLSELVMVNTTFLSPEDGKVLLTTSPAYVVVSGGKVHEYWKVKVES